jgi:beta-RFAP synthase
MVRVWTPSRLHFGLLSLGEPPGSSRRLEPAGAPALLSRRYGGVGLMVEQPGLQLTASPAADWSAEGPAGARALAFATQFADSIRRERPDADLRPQRLVVQQAPPEHVGLGVGTQLGLAVGRAVAEAWGLLMDASDLAQRLGRGRRSALGVHGFVHGGFLVESGTRPGIDRLPPLTARASFPPEWRVVLATPRAAPGLHGCAERDAFDRLAAYHAQLAARGADAAAHTGALCRLALLGMLPALAEADLEAFGESLFEFNRRVGEAFAPVQGGVYSSREAAACVEFLRGEGARGAGQSSWGPTVFGVVGDEERAADLRRRLADRFGLGPGDAWTTAPSNTGARVEPG